MGTQMGLQMVSKTVPRMGCESFSAICGLHDRVGPGVLRIALVALEVRGKVRGKAKLSQGLDLL